MKVLIPLAGAGTRLQPHTFAHPKPLIHVAGKPILAHILDPIVEIKPDEVIFVVGYMGDDIRAYVDAKYPSLNASYVEQSQLLGLGYALYLALKDNPSDELLVVLGDTIVTVDLQKFIDTDDWVLGLRQVDDPSRFGIAEVNGGRITGMEEKPSEPKSNLALIGLYYFKSGNLLRDHLKGVIDAGKTTRGEYQLTDALATMIDDGIRFVPFEVTGWYDCGKIETLLATNQTLLKHQPQPDTPDQSVVIKPVYIAPGASITGCVIGPHVSIGEGAVLRHSVITNSIINANAQVENVVLTDSVIGESAVVTAEKSTLDIADKSNVKL